MAISYTEFKSIAKKVADALEGGYYHPDMKLKMSASNAKKMGTSGETMLGIDRKHGIALSIYPEWKEFWAIIDNNNARKNWKHYYMGGSNFTRLKELATSMMFKWYTSLANKNLTSKSLQAVDNDERLKLHFAYAAWNGAGWFEKMARVTNNDTAANKNKETIAANALLYRVNNSNSLIAQSGAKFKKLFAEIGKGIEPVKKKTGGSLFLVLIVIVIAVIVLPKLIK